LLVRSILALPNVYIYIYIIHGKVRNAYIFLVNLTVEMLLGRGTKLGLEGDFKNDLKWRQILICELDLLAPVNMELGLS
jgi:hypothetical protein